MYLFGDEGRWFVEKCKSRIDSINVKAPENDNEKNSHNPRTLLD